MITYFNYFKILKEEIFFSFALDFVISIKTNKEDRII